jgi:hypothetical protein
MKVQGAVKALLSSPVRTRVHSCALQVPAQFASSKLVVKLVKLGELEVCQR